MTIGRNRVLATTQPECPSASLCKAIDSDVMSYGDFAFDPSMDRKPVIEGDRPVTLGVRRSVSKLSKIFGLLLVGVSSLAAVVALRQYIDGNLGHDPIKLRSLIREIGFLVMGAALYIQSLKGSTRLFIDAGGFVIRRSWRDKRLSWFQVSHLEVADGDRPGDRGVNVYFHDRRKKWLIPDIFELEKDELADLMARYGSLRVDNALLPEEAEEVPYWARKKQVTGQQQDIK